jgi:hypothetical protein
MPAWLRKDTHRCVDSPYKTYLCIIGTTLPHTHTYSYHVFSQFFYYHGTSERRTLQYSLPITHAPNISLMCVCVCESDALLETRGQRDVLTYANRDANRKHDLTRRCAIHAHVHRPGCGHVEAAGFRSAPTPRMVGQFLSSRAEKAREHSGAEARRPNPGAHELERVLDWLPLHPAWTSCPDGRS